MNKFYSFKKLVISTAVMACLCSTAFAAETSGDADPDEMWAATHPITSLSPFLQGLTENTLPRRLIFVIGGKQSAQRPLEMLFPDPLVHYGWSPSLTRTANPFKGRSA